MSCDGLMAVPTSALWEQLFWTFGDKGKAWSGLDAAGIP